MLPPRAERGHTMPPGLGNTPRRVAPSVWRGVALTGMMRASIALWRAQQKPYRAWWALVNYQAVGAASPPALPGDAPVRTWEAV
jgi:hypothetical protein